MTIHKEILSGSTSSGALAVNTVEPFMGIMRQILVKPTTGTTQYNCTITDDNDLVIQCENSIVGNYSPEVALPVRGIYTIDIDSATKDEAFTISLVVEE